MVLWKFPLWLLGQPSGISREKYCKKCSCSMWPFIILSDRWWDREMSRHPSPGRWLSQLAGPGSGHFSILRARAGVGMRESGRSRSQELHNNVSESMSGSGRWYDTVMTPSPRAKDAKHFYFVIVSRVILSHVWALPDKILCWKGNICFPLKDSLWGPFLLFLFFNSCVA